MRRLGLIDYGLQRDRVRDQFAVGPLGLPIERDFHFAPTRTISAYADLAQENRRIIT